MDSRNRGKGWLLAFNGEGYLLRSTNCKSLIPRDQSDTRGSLRAVDSHRVSQVNPTNPARLPGRASMASHRAKSNRLKGIPDFSPTDSPAHPAARLWHTKCLGNRIVVGIHGNYLAGSIAWPGLWVKSFAAALWGKPRANGLKRACFGAGSPWKCVCVSQLIGNNL